MISNNDKLIWRAFKDRNEEALSVIYNQHVDFLFFYGKKILHDDDLILDVIQDLFLYIIKKRDSLGDTENVRMYLLKSFRRRLFEKIRIKKKEQELSSDYSLDFHITFSIEEELIREEENEHSIRELRKAMSKLNAKQREVLYYKYTCGFNYHQICEIMSISYDAARQFNLCRRSS